MAKRGGKRPGAGRKPGEATLLAQKARQYIAEQLDKKLKPIVQRALWQAERGDKQARDWLSAYAWGKPVQALEHSGPEGKPIPIEISEIIAKKNNIKA